jgi:hypothetical protein
MLLLNAERLVSARRFIVNETRARALLRARLLRSPLDGPVGRELPEPRVVVDNLDVLAAKDAFSGPLSSLGLVPLLEVDEDALELGAVLSRLGDHVNVVNLTESDLANHKGDAFIGNISEHTRNAQAGPRHILGTRSRS